MICAPKTSSGRFDLFSKELKHFGPRLAFKCAADAQDWPSAGLSLERIRQIIAVNLPLGLLVVLIAASGRFWR